MEELEDQGRYDIGLDSGVAKDEDDVEVVNDCR